MNLRAATCLVLVCVALVALSPADAGEQNNNRSGDVSVLLEVDDCPCRQEPVCECKSKLVKPLTVSKGAIVDGQPVKIGGDESSTAEESAASSESTTSEESSSEESSSGGASTDPAAAEDSSSDMQSSAEISESVSDETAESQEKEGMPSDDESGAEDAAAEVSLDEDMPAPSAGGAEGSEESSEGTSFDEKVSEEILKNDAPVSANDADVDTTQAESASNEPDPVSSVEDDGAEDESISSDETTEEASGSDEVGGADESSVAPEDSEVAEDGTASENTVESEEEEDSATEDDATLEEEGSASTASVEEESTEEAASEEATAEDSESGDAVDNDTTTEDSSEESSDDDATPEKEDDDQCGEQCKKEALSTKNAAEAAERAAVAASTAAQDAAKASERIERSMQINADLVKKVDQQYTERRKQELLEQEKRDRIRREELDAARKAAENHLVETLRAKILAMMKADREDEEKDKLREERTKRLQLAARQKYAKEKAAMQEEIAKMSEAKREHFKEALEKRAEQERITDVKLQEAVEVEKAAVKAHEEKTKSRAAEIEELRQKALEEQQKIEAAKAELEQQDADAAKVKEEITKQKVKARLAKQAALEAAEKVKQEAAAESQAKQKEAEELKQKDAKEEEDKAAEKTKFQEAQAKAQEVALAHEKEVAALAQKKLKEENEKSIEKIKEEGVKQQEKIAALKGEQATKAQQAAEAKIEAEKAAARAEQDAKRVAEGNEKKSAVEKIQEEHSKKVADEEAAKKAASAAADAERAKVAAEEEKGKSEAKAKQDEKAATEAAVKKTNEEAEKKALAEKASEMASKTKVLKEKEAAAEKAEEESQKKIAAVKTEEEKEKKVVKAKEEASKKAFADEQAAKKEQIEEAKSKDLAKKAKEEAEKAAAKAAAEKAEKEAIERASEAKAKKGNAITLSKAVIPYGHNYAQPVWIRIGGLCVLSGVAYSAENARDWIANLPEYCRPRGRIIFGQGTAPLANHQPETTRADVLTDGRIWVNPGDGKIRRGWFGFDNMLFPVDGAATKKLDLAARWVNYESGYAQATFYKQGGYCVLSGLIKSSGSFNSHIATLPENCRPVDGRLIFRANHHEVSWRVDVLTNGQVHYVTGGRPHPWMSLDGIAFFTESESNPIDLAYGWGPYNHGYRKPSFRVENSLCALSGLLTGHNGNTDVGVIGRLPKNCRPMGRLIFHTNVHQFTKRIDVYPDGRVMAVEGLAHHSWLSLDGIKFAVDGPELKVEPEPKPTLTTAGLSLVNGFKPYGGDYRTPRIHRYGKICLMSGLLKASNLRDIFTTVPDFCKPENKRRIFDVHVSGTPTARVDLQGDGRIGWVAGASSGGWMPIDQIMYGAKNARFNDLPLHSNYLNYDRGYAGATWFRQGDFCIVSGLIRRNNWQVLPGGHMFTLPPECRPLDGRLIIGLNHHQYTHRVDVLANGQVHWIQGSRTHTWLSLDGMYFYVRSPNVIEYMPYFSKYGGSYRAPSYHREGPLCALSGLVRAHHGHFFHITTLPEQCRPNDRMIFHTNHHQWTLRVDVLPDGRVMHISGNRGHGWVSLDGIAFMVDYKAPAYVKAFAHTAAASTDISMINGYEPYGNSYQNPGYALTGAVCFLQGLVRGGLEQLTFMKVPEACRPDYRTTFDTFVSNRGAAQIDVFQNGNVQWIGGSTSGDWIPLDSMLYFKSGIKGNLIELRFNWYNVGGDYAPASYIRQGDLCVLQGRIYVAPWSTSYWHNPMFYLPPECRPEGPEGRLIFHANAREYTHRLDLLTDGSMHWIRGGRAHSWISLDGIAFFRRGMRTLDMYNNWRQYAGSYRIPSYKKQGSICSLSGLTNTGNNHYITRLPTECRPKARRIFSTHCANWNCRIDVLPDGQVHAVSGRGGWVSLDGITYSVNHEYSHAIEGESGVTVSKAGTALKLLNGAVPHGQGFRSPVYTVQDKICVLSGVADAVNVRKVLTVLPEACRPEGRHVFTLADDRSAPTRVDITADGEVKWIAGSGRGRFSLDGILFPVAGVTSTKLDLANWYVPYGGEYAPPAYTVIGDMCIVSGVMRIRQQEGTFHAGHLFTLPEDCRPKDGRLIFNLDHNEYNNRVDVLTNGQVHWIAGGRTHSWMSLDGISFLRSTSSNGLAFRNGYNNYGYGYRNPSWKRVGNMCVFSGLVRGNSGWPWARIPIECRPSEKLVFALNNHQYVTLGEVWPDGRILVAKENPMHHGWVSIDGLHFMVDPGKRGAVDAVYDMKDMADAGGLTFFNGFTNYGSGYRVPTVYLNDKICMLSGLMRGPQMAATYLGIKNKACWPKERLVFDVELNGYSTARIDLLPNGQLRWAAGSQNADWVPLDGITYPRATTQVGEIELWHDWGPYGAGYAQPGWIRDGNVCILTGFIKAYHFNRWVGVLPPACRPRDGRTIHKVNHEKYSWRLDILQDGRMYIDWYALHTNMRHFSLSNIHFNVNRGNVASLGSGWSHYNSGYRPVQWTKQGNMCTLSGLARGSAQYVAQFPAECRPSQRLIFHVSNHNYRVRLDVLTNGWVVKVTPNWHGWVSTEGIAFTV